jgi:protein involved in polysaccharide export with SLBB domain
VVLSLNVANRLLGRVYIWGQVHSQGPVNLMVNEQLTAAKAIMQAGGFADFAKKRKVQVVRTTDKGTNQTFDLDMEDIMDNGDTAKDMVLKPNDMIIVPTRLINF